MADIDIMRERITWDNGTDPLSDSEYEAITKAVSGGLNPTTVAELPLILKSRHIVYWHSAQNMPSYHNGMYAGGGDCGQSVALGENETLGNISKGTQFGTLGAQATASIAGSIAPNLLQSGFGTALKAVPIVGTIASVILAPLSFISAHHAKAVVVEQGNLCQMANAVNAHLDDIDNQFNNGLITASQAEQALSNLKNGARQIVQQIYKECNAACFEMHFLDGLILLRTKYLYPKSHPVTAVTSPITNAVTNPSVASFKNAAKSPIGITLLIVAGLIVAKKVLFTGAAV